MPGSARACAAAGVALRDLDAVVTGAGPGPFTGLRVGMVTAAALGDALGIPVHGVCSLDAIAAATLYADPVRTAPFSSSPTPAAARSTGRSTTARAAASTARMSRPPPC